jgi:PAS domain S-box-containing protein
MKSSTTKNHFFSSFRSRLFLSVAIVNAILMSIFIIDIATRQRAVILENQFREAEGIAKSISATSAQWIASNDVAGLQELVEAQSHFPELSFAIITNNHSQILAHSDKTKIGQFLLDLPNTTKEITISKTPELTDVAIPIFLSNKHLGWVRIGLGQKNTSEQLKTITNNGIIYGFLTVLIGSIIVWFLGSFITRRLYFIQETINEIAKGNTSARSRLTGNDEVTALAKEFNKMLDAKEENEKALQETNAYLENLINYANAPIIVWDPQFHITRFNHAFEFITGYTEKEILGQSLKMLFPPEQVKNSMDLIRKTSTGERWESVEIEILHRDKSTRNVLWNSATLFAPDGKTQVATIAQGQDITERIHAEEEIVKAKEHAEENDRLKSAFLANMSHEIRTPMNGIIGFAELLKEPGITGEDRQEYIQIIEKSGVRMLNIINDIVDISKIESGLMQVSISETNINNQIEYIYTFFNPEVTGNGLKFSYKNSLSTIEAVLKTDQEKIYAVLINLVKNAIKYTQKGFIEFGYTVKLGNKIGEVDKIEFYVKDSGLGIPTNKLEAVFDRFIQVDISDKGAIQGAGLGLSISKAYVEMLGGKIWVESEEGKGSTFYFTIPYITESEIEILNKDISPKVENSNKIKNLKILIVEDDAISKLLISKVVSTYSKNVLKVSTGVEAVETCLNNPDIDLVLMDVNMPEMNGHDATRLIRQFNKEVIIIAQTAYGMTSDREEAIASGCNDYISKPINIDKLRVLIQNYFSK